MKVEELICHLQASLLVCLLATPLAAQEVRQITEDESGIFCNFAIQTSFDELATYVQRQGWELGDMLYQTVCPMASTTSNPYYGNVFSASARYNGYIADVVRYSSRYLFQNNQQAIWIALVTGSNVPEGSPSVFVELVSAWENFPNKRNVLEIAAQTICLSIDRYDLKGLEDIRANECMTPPFVFPPRGE